MGEVKVLWYPHTVLICPPCILSKSCSPARDTVSEVIQTGSSRVSFSGLFHHDYFDYLDRHLPLLFFCFVCFFYSFFFILLFYPTEAGEMNADVVTDNLTALNRHIAHMAESAIQSATSSSSSSSLPSSKSVEECVSLSNSGFEQQVILI